MQIRASFERAVEKYPLRVLVSSLSKEGLMPLIEFLHEWEIPQRAKKTSFTEEEVEQEEE
ncbi:hypothetical protein H0X06_05385 [Candidatus Dependentiae bacterium]|nr:hypothetical protein [Candidatus Dependentiae bacterium]